MGPNNNFLPSTTGGSGAPKLTKPLIKVDLNGKMVKTFAVDPLETFESLSKRAAAKYPEPEPELDQFKIFLTEKSGDGKSKKQQTQL